ncbi:hypothetical protein [Clostridium sp.]|uniref:hypothetical protein n=1 Tax=Clostridium sp. TaxID=1506 RepID=UPI002FC7B474
MGNIKFYIKLIKIDKKTSAAYVLSLAMGFLILFNIFNLFFLDGIRPEESGEKIFFGGVILVIAAIILLLGYYSNLFFLSRRGKEVGVELMSGLSLVGLSVSFIVQNIILSGLAAFIGVIGGVILLPIFNALAFNLIGISGDRYAISMDGIFCTVLVIIIQIMFVGAVDVGVGHRTEVCNLIKNSSKGYNPKKKETSILKTLIYFIMFMVPIMSIFFINFTNEGYEVIIQMTAIIGGIGLAFFIKDGIPCIIELYLNKIGRKDPIKVMYLRNLKYIMEKSAVIMICFSVIIIAITVVIGGAGNDIRFSTVSTIGLSSTTVLLSITIIYKIVIEALNRKNSFKQMFLLGYTKEKIAQIIEKEVLMYYFIVFIMPFLQGLFIFYGYVKSRTIKVEILLTLAIVIVVLAVATFFISYNVYKKIILNSDDVLGGR